jgi:hypothetical protein
MQREVRESVGEVLIDRKLATRVYRTRELVGDEPEEVEISPRTGKPKRKYKRRDLAAED